MARKRYEYYSDTGLIAAASVEEHPTTFKDVADYAPFVFARIINLSRRALEINIDGDLTKSIYVPAGAKRLIEQKFKRLQIKNTHATKALDVVAIVEIMNEVAYNGR